LSPVEADGAYWVIPCREKRTYLRAARGPARGEKEMTDADARLWHPWLRINRVLYTRWSEIGSA